MYEIFDELLKKHNITPYRVHKETGVPQSTLSDWKNGKSIPKIDNMQKIAEYFNVTVDYLIGNGKKNKPIKNDELSEKCKKLIDIFNNVPVEQQELVLRMIEAALKNE